MCEGKGVRRACEDEGARRVEVCKDLIMCGVSVWVWGCEEVYV